MKYKVCPSCGEIIDDFRKVELVEWGSRAIGVSYQGGNLLFDEKDFCPDQDRYELICIKCGATICESYPEAEEYLLELGKAKENA